MRRALLIALLLAAATPALAEDVKSLTEQHLKQWIAIHDKGDAAALTALYTSDAVLMPNGEAKPIIGEAAIRNFFDGFLKQRASNLSIPVTEAKQIDNNHILAMGTWSGDIPGQNGATMRIGGTG
jgi:ketosteroid isomerase-like protein